MSLANNGNAVELLSPNFRKRALLLEMVVPWGVIDKRHVELLAFPSANVLRSQFFILLHFSSLKSSLQIPQVVILLLDPVLRGNA